MCAARSGFWILRPDFYPTPRRLVQFRCIGPCLECFGLPSGSILLVDTLLPPKIGDFALIETPEAHDVTGHVHQAKLLAMRRVGGQDIVTCESICPPYPLEATDKVLGTGVAAILPDLPDGDPLAREMDAFLDDYIRKANKLYPQLNWKRRPPTPTMNRTIS
jgi:hypothetical protein